MKRILLTGMSGVGKSTLIEALAARGYQAVDLDQPAWSEHDADGDWIWRAERVRELLARDDGELLFVSGCASNQGQFYARFAAVVLLAAPAPVLIERLATRTNNQYGKRPEELAEVLGYLESVEPLLRRGATHELDAAAPLDQVLAAVLRVAAE
jgi:shikimate kinase